MFTRKYHKIALMLAVFLAISAIFCFPPKASFAAETQTVTVVGTPPVAAYVHPRILITPDELPALRNRLETSAIGRRSMQSIRAWLDYVLLDDTKLKPLYQALINGDPEVLKTFPTTYSSYLVNVFSLEGFYCMINDDMAKGTELAAALVSCVRILSDIIPNANLKKAIGTEFYNLGYCYDFIYNYMTDDQRKIVRDFIAANTNGALLPVSTYSTPELCGDNLTPVSTQRALLALSIEGEEGYDPNVYRQAVLSMDYYFKYGIYPTGASTEDMHYLNYGMSFGSQTLIAMARRGDSLFDNPNFQKLKDWYVNSIEPFGYKFTTLGDTTNDQGGLLPNYVLMKWLNPNDPVIDFIWRNRVRDDYTGIKFRGDFLMAAMFGLDWKGGETTEKAPIADQWGVDNTNIPIVTLAQYKPAKLNLPNSFFDNNRGLYITRNEWSKDAMVMQFETNSNLNGPSHTHSNSNDFTLTALGQKWAIDRGFHIFESKNHSSILIDGKGQGFFGAYGKNEGLLDADFGTVFIGNAKNAYDYRYTFKGRINNDENKGYTWEFEPRSLRLESDTNSTFRALENPVQKAFRSVAMLRGTTPYVLVMDDIQKDANEHLYEWLMQVPNELEAKSIVGGDMILGLDDETADSPRMLVRSLESKDTTNPTMRDTYVRAGFEAFEVKNSDLTGSYKTEKFGMGKRVVLSSRSVNPAFKTLLFPHHQGAEMPTTTLQGSKLTIQWTGQKDEYTFQSLADGRTAFGMIRNGGEAFLIVGLTQYNPTSDISVVADKSGANAVYEKNSLIINGSGWEKLTVNAPDIRKVYVNGNDVEFTRTATGVIVTE